MFELTAIYTHTYLGSISPSQHSVEIMLGRHPGGSLHTSSTMALLAIGAVRPNWQCQDDIKLFLHPLSVAIDNASLNRLLSSTPSIRLPALALSSGLPHAGDWLNGVPSCAIREFRCCLRYWFGVPLDSHQYT